MAAIHQCCRTLHLRPIQLLGNQRGVAWHARYGIGHILFSHLPRGRLCVLRHHDDFDSACAVLQKIRQAGSSHAADCSINWYLAIRLHLDAGRCRRKCCLIPGPVQGGRADGLVTAGMAHISTQTPVAGVLARRSRFLTSMEDAAGSGAAPWHPRTGRAVMQGSYVYVVYLTKVRQEESWYVSIR